jgi:hypothetical protein
MIRYANKKTVHFRALFALTDMTLLREFAYTCVELNRRGQPPTKKMGEAKAKTPLTPPITT